MKLTLEPAIEHHRCKIAVLTRQIVFEQCPGSGLGAAGFKQPVAVLINHAGVTTIFGPTGEVIPIDEFRSRFSGQLASLQNFENRSD